MHLLPPLAILGLEPWMIAVVIPVAGLIFAAVMGISAMHFKSQERERWHQTARVALEKGQPLPPYPGNRRESDERDEDVSQHDVRGGLVLLAVGGGLWMMFKAFAPIFRYVGAIPAFIGVALLVYSAGRALFSRRSGTSDRRPPQS